MSTPNPTRVVDHPVTAHARRLTELAASIDEPHPFHKGQLVRWKSGLRNRLLPAYNEQAVVREVLSAPIYDACEKSRCAHSPDFGEPLTLVLGIFDPDGDFAELRYDGRRFEPITRPEHA